MGNNWAIRRPVVVLHATKDPASFSFGIVVFTQLDFLPPGLALSQSKPKAADEACRERAAEGSHEASHLSALLGQFDGWEGFNKEKGFEESAPGCLVNLRRPPAALNDTSSARPACAFKPTRPIFPGCR